MVLNRGTLFGLAVAVLLVLVALLIGFPTAALLAGIYLVGFAVHRFMKSRKRP